MSSYAANPVPPPYDAERRIYSSPGVSYYNDQERTGMCATLGRIPYLTLLGLLLIGGGCACLMLGYHTFAPGIIDTYDAMGYNTTMGKDWSKKVADFINDQKEKGKDSYYSPENADYIIVDSVIAGVAVLFLLVLAVVGTGFTREVCCQGRSCCQGYLMFLNFVTGLVSLVFLAGFVAVGFVFLVPVAATYYLDDQCNAVGADATKKPCFDMATFGLSEKNQTPPSASQVCFGDNGLCERLDEMQRGFIYWTSGAFGASLGLVFVLMAIAANFAHFRDMKKVENEEKYVF